MHSKPVDLRTPITREGGNPVTSIILRRPLARDLQGLAIGAVLAMHADAVSVLVTRLAEPFVTQEEVAGLDGADLVALGVRLLQDFFGTPTEMPKAP